MTELCFAGMYKSLMHNRQIKETAGKYQGRSVQLWRVLGVADYGGTLAEMVWMRWFWLSMQPNVMQLDQMPSYTTWFLQNCFDNF